MVKPFAVVTDIETTGLDAIRDVPLEIGFALIDKDGNVIDSTDCLVWEQTDEFQRGVTRGLRNDFVNDMHVKNGLWAELEGLPHSNLAIYSREAVDDYLLKVLQAWGLQKGETPMLGNSIGSLDRPFVIQHFPKVNDWLSYRNIDISTIKELCKAHNPKLYEGMVNAGLIGKKDDAPHRVMGDITACIKEYGAYIENFFFIED